MHREDQWVNEERTATCPCAQSLLLARSISNPSPSGQVGFPLKAGGSQLRFMLLGWQQTFQFSHEGPSGKATSSPWTLKEAPASFAQAGRGKLDSNPMPSYNFPSANGSIEAVRKLQYTTGT